MGTTKPFEEELREGEASALAYKIAAERDRLRERVAVLEEALRPLAAVTEHAGFINEGDPERLGLWIGCSSAGDQIRITLADAIKAKEAMDG